MQQQYVKKQKIFFPNLDGLRFVCFFMVFLFHCYKTTFTGIAGTPAYNWAKFLFQNGELGVNFFFVLSGFLITYLLISEKQLIGNISLKNFYIRRILRIWPLFYVCIFIGFIIFPLIKQIAGHTSDEIAQPVYYIFFANNFDYINSWPSYPDALILIVLWSVAVEEQFYLTWPVFLKFISKKLYPGLFVFIIIGTLIFRSFHISSSEHDYAVRNFHTLAVIGDMALGALFAYYCSYESAFLRLIVNFKKWQVLLLYILALCLYLFRHILFENPVAGIFERAIIAFFFGMIILEQNFSKNSLFKFSRFKTISKLGIYTYGLYCLHFFVISIVNAAFPKTGIGLHSFIAAASATVISLGIVIGLGIFSYTFFEKRFLKLKDRFAFIVK